MTSAEMEKGFQEIWKLFEKTDKKIQETDRILSKRFKEADKILTERFKETDKRLDKKFSDMTKAVSDLTGKWSKFVEGLIAPAVETLFQDWAIEVDTTYQRVKRHRNGEQIEIDILGVSNEYVVLVEAKSTLKVDDVDEHKERLNKFKKLFPEYKDKKVVGAVGGIVIEENSDRYAYKNGLFVIAEKGESVKVLNDLKFKPKIW